MRLRCVSIVPFGIPVVPLEYGSTASWSSSTAPSKGAAAPVPFSASSGVAPAGASAPRTRTEMASDRPDARTASSAFSRQQGCAMTTVASQSSSCLPISVAE